jgi:hypothetical protein
LGQFSIRHLFAGLVWGRVQRGHDAPPGFRRRIGNELDHHLMAHQWTTTPVFGDMATQAMCNLVPLTGPRRKMAHVDFQAGGVAQLLPGYFPQPRAPAMTAAAIGSHEDVLRLRIQTLSHPLPPLRQGGHGKDRRLMINTDADPSTVVRPVIDTIGHGFAQLLVEKVMHPYPLRNALGLRFAPTIGKVADQCFFRRIDRDDGLTAWLKVFDPGMDVLKLCIPIWMRRPHGRD